MDVDDPPPTLELPAVPPIDVDDPTPTLELPAVPPPAQRRRWRRSVIAAAVVLVGALGGGLGVAAMTTGRPNALPRSISATTRSTAPLSATLNIMAWIAPNTGNRTTINLFVTITNETASSVPFSGIEAAFFDQYGDELATVEVPLAIGGGGGSDASPSPGQAIAPHVSWTWSDIQVVPSNATSVRVLTYIP